jgi:hypothetical protein
LSFEEGILESSGEGLQLFGETDQVCKGCGIQFFHDLGQMGLDVSDDEENRLLLLL